MTALPQAFLDRPLAHRGLHDRARGVIENSASAFRAAIEAGYGIECDLQLSADGCAMVFHDEGLDRLTGETGPVRSRSAAELGAIRLGGSDDTIRPLDEMLALVAGRVPLLIEIKDQHGALGPTDGMLEGETARALASYGGPIAVMSFNPHAMAAFHTSAPDVPVGLVTCAFTPDDWPGVPEARLSELASMPDLNRVGATFISHDRADLGAAPVARARADGYTILCWTVRSLEQDRAAREIADNITFEGYRA
jgi:glycerophosphoryl diester phosphodiesterase